MEGHTPNCQTERKTTIRVEETETMSAMHVAGRELEFNKKGHMVHFDHWDRDVAQALAAEEGLHPHRLPLGGDRVPARVLRAPTTTRRPRAW